MGAALFLSAPAWAEKFDLICTKTSSEDANGTDVFVRIKLSVDTNNTKQNGVIVHKSSSADGRWERAMDASLHPDLRGTWDFFHPVAPPGYMIAPNEYMVDQDTLKLTETSENGEHWKAQCRKATYSG